MARVDLALLGSGEQIGELAQIHGEQFIQGVAISFARKMLPHAPWPDDKPIPLLPDQDDELRVRFREFVEQERLRQLELVEAFADEAPLDAAKDEGRSGR